MNLKLKERKEFFLVKSIIVFVGKKLKSSLMINTRHDHLLSKQELYDLILDSVPRGETPQNAVCYHYLVNDERKYLQTTEVITDSKFTEQ
jgi:hypothetical protein